MTPMLRIVLKHWSKRHWFGLGVISAAIVVTAIHIYRQNHKPPLHVTILGFTNKVIHASSRGYSAMPKLLFVVSNSSRERISIAPIHKAYPLPILKPDFDSYLMLSSFALEPGESILESSFFPNHPPPWQFKIAYSRQGLKERVLHQLGGRGEFFGHAFGTIADVFSPTQKLCWMHIGWPEMTNGPAREDLTRFAEPRRRYHITAPPLPIRIMLPTSEVTNNEPARIP